MKRQALTTLLSLLLSSACLDARQEVATGAADEPDWQELFDGQSLDGWARMGGEATYRVEDGTIVGTTAPNTPNTFLCTKRSFGDFILEYEFLIHPELNSGVQIRSHYSDERVRGYQVEIDPDEQRHRDWTAGIYEEGLRGWLNDLSRNDAARAAFRRRQWNQIRVEARGAHLRTWLNGVPAADLLDGDAMEGFIGLQVHGVGSREDPLEVRWRNLRFEDLGRSRWVPVAIAEPAALTVAAEPGQDFARRFELRFEGGPCRLDWPGGPIELKPKEGAEQVRLFLCRAGERLLLDVRGHAKAETTLQGDEAVLLDVVPVEGGKGRLTVLSAEELRSGD